ncbi:hypothetical protein RB594_008866 [Gaeumannomyces avenae]
MKGELPKLFKEVESLKATCQQIHDITLLLSKHLPDDVVAMLRAVEEDLNDTILDLEKFGDKCAVSTRMQQKDKMVPKHQALRWLWMRPQLPRLYGRARGTRMLNEGLHNAISLAITGLIRPLPEVPVTVGDLEAKPDGLPLSLAPDQNPGPQQSAEAMTPDSSAAALPSPSNGTTADVGQPQVTPLGICPSDCGCKCHRDGIRTSVWGFPGLQKSLGALRVSHTSRAAKRNIPNCVWEGYSSPIEVQYLLPTWLYVSILLISAFCSSLTGLGLKVHFSHGGFLSPRSGVFHFTQHGKPGHFQQLSRMREVYYPSDLFAWHGEQTMMEIAIESFNIAIIEFLLLYWAPTLRHTGVSNIVNS